MKIQVIEVKELENGGAEVIIDIDEETKKFLINEGFISVLLKGTVVVKELWEQEYSDELKEEEKKWDFSELSTRVKHCLEAESIETVKQLEEFYASGRIFLVENLGFSGLRELTKWYFKNAKE